MDPVYLYTSLSCAHQLSLLHLKPAGNPGQRVGEDQSRPFYPQTLKNTTSRETNSPDFRRFDVTSAAIESS